MGERGSVWGPSYPGVLLHANMDFLLRWRLNKHLIPLTSRIAAKYSYTINDVQQEKQTAEAVGCFSQFPQGVQNTPTLS